MKIEFTETKRMLERARYENDPRLAAVYLTEAMDLIVVALERMQKETAK